MADDDNGWHHAIEHDEGAEQGEAALALVVIFTEQVEVEHETQHEDTDKQYLPRQHQPFLPDGLTAFDGFFP